MASKYMHERKSKNVQKFERYLDDLNDCTNTYTERETFAGSLSKKHNRKSSKKP